MNNSIKE